MTLTSRQLVSQYPVGRGPDRNELMSGKNVRYKFLGSYILVFVGLLIGFFVVTIPLFISDIINNLSQIDEQLEIPSEDLEQHKENHSRQWTLP